MEELKATPFLLLALFHLCVIYMVLYFSHIFFCVNKVRISVFCRADVSLGIRDGFSHG